MSDFSLTTLFVVPVGLEAVPSSGSTQDLAAGDVGVFLNTYAFATAGNIAAAPYFYIAQGRTNTYLLGSKRSDKISGCPQAGVACKTNVTEWYKVTGCGVPVNQITELSAWSLKCGEDVTITLRAHSSYLDSLYFNGFTRSITVTAPCCECGADPCVDTDVPALLDLLIAKFNEPLGPGANPDNIKITDFFEFQRIGDDADAVLRITGLPLTAYGQPCDVAAFPHEYDRMWFRAFAYEGPATTADFIVNDACDIVANATITQRSSYLTGGAEEIKQLEKNYYSYQSGYLKHLYRIAGYNANFESWVTDGQFYDTYYIKFNELDPGAYNWGAYLKTDSTVIIACVSGGAYATDIEAILVAALGAVAADNACITTTTTTSAAPTTTTTSTLVVIP